MLLGELGINTVSTQQAGVKMRWELRRVGG